MVTQDKRVIFRGCSASINPFIIFLRAEELCNTSSSLLQWRLDAATESEGWSAYLSDQVSIFSVNQHHSAQLLQEGERRIQLQIRENYYHHLS